jgi:hypothetical protein
MLRICEGHDASFTNNYSLCSLYDIRCIVFYDFLEYKMYWEIVGFITLI